ncbi:MAG: MFS transporter [Acidobacteria bacterium]|nr:MFS transporter [Acidobacteriota bacterium]
MTDTPKTRKKRFPALFWLVILFEFFERGAYYGMMSVFSVYCTDVLLFPKDHVGVLKSVIQPILYFLPILSGALADRFGFRKALTVAFAFLGTGYFLISRATEYTPVFLAMVVMALGAGIFKPIVSGTIARVTDKESSSVGFGIYYWSINLGAFLFPLFLVPWLKSIAWPWVFVTAALCTGAMLVPTLLFYRDPAKPPLPEGAAPETKKSALKTVADAFEIIYSPLVLLRHAMARRSWQVLVVLFLGALGYVAIQEYLTPRFEKFQVRRFPAASVEGALTLEVVRNEIVGKDYALEPGKNGKPATLTIHRPGDRDRFLPALVRDLAAAGLPCPSPGKLADEIRSVEKPRTLWLIYLPDPRETSILVQQPVGEARGEGIVTVSAPTADERLVKVILERMAASDPSLSAVEEGAVRKALADSSRRPFFLLFVVLVLATGLVILFLRPRVAALPDGRRTLVVMAAGIAMMLILWTIPGLSTFSRVLCSIIYLTLLSLFTIDGADAARFREHFRFLSMIFIYSGFWVLYFQMFDSVLWYVQAYVRADSLNAAINGFFGTFGLKPGFRFDVEHVTVINGGTIICLQLVVSWLVKKAPALPTMIVGILLGTVGMAILAISPSIWVFLIGNIIFSIGEMTAHPKFFSYVGQIAPKEKLAMYMGYCSLYGVIGSSIAGVLGANLYVHYVDNLNQPRTLWLIFAGIGLATVIGLLLYHLFVGKREKAEA